MINNNIAQEQNFLIFEALNKIGVEVNPKVLEGLTTLALSSLTIPLNTSTSLPLKYYNTTCFTRTSAGILTELSLLPPQINELSLYDDLLYHLLLYTGGKSLLLFCNINNEVLLALLSSPRTMEYICKQEWFQSLKSKIIKEIGLPTLKKAVYYIGKKLAKKYVEKNLVKPIERIIQDGKEKIIKNISESIQEFAKQKKSILGELIEDSKETVTSLKEVLLQGEVPSLQQVENIIDQSSRINTNFFKLLDPPKIRLHNKIYSPRRPLFSRISAAWGLLGSSHPELTPLLLINPASPASELAIRTIGSLLAYNSGQNLLSLLGTEVACKIIPNKLNSIESHRILSQNFGEKINHVIQEINHNKEAIHNWLLTKGIKRKDLQEIETFLPQLVATIGYTVFNYNSHPIMHAWNSPTFVQYLGIMADTTHLANAETFEYRQSALSAFCLQTITGIGLSALEIMGGREIRPSTAILSGFLCMPYIADKVVESEFFENQIRQPLIKKICDNEELPTILTVNRITDKIFSLLPKKISQQSPSIAIGKNLKDISINLLIGNSLAKKYVRYSHLIKLKKALLLTSQSLLTLANKGATVWARYTLASTVNSYSQMIGEKVLDKEGQEGLFEMAGGIAIIANQPRDKIAIPVTVITLSTLYTTHSPLISSITYVATTSLLRNSKVQNLAISIQDRTRQGIANFPNTNVAQMAISLQEQAKQTMTDLSNIALEEVENRLYEQPDIKSLQSQLLGLIATHLTQNILIGASVVEMSDQLLRSTKLATTTEKIINFSLKSTFWGVNQIFTEIDNMASFLK